MKHRERVAIALDHETPDRCPMQISYTPEFENRLRMEYRNHRERFPDEEKSGDLHGLEIALDQDLLLTFSGRLSDEYESHRIENPDGTTTDEWGIVRKKVRYETRFGVGEYSEMVGHPLANEEAIDSYQAPDASNPALYREVRELVRSYGEEYWIVGCAVTTIFETAWALRGYEQILMDLATNPGLVEKLLDIPFHYHLEVARRLTELGVDMIWLGDDVGAQETMLISPETWRRLLKPRMAELIAVLKRIQPQIKIAYHSDGFITPIISDLIEIGVDVLNPVQPQCMNPIELKRKFGDRLCFWGAIDEQFLLPFGNPADVEREIRRLVRTVGENGGLILAPTHNVQLDTPMENFWAMLNTIRNTGV